MRLVRQLSPNLQLSPVHEGWGRPQHQLEPLAFRRTSQRGCTTRTCGRVSIDEACSTHHVTWSNLTRLEFNSSAMSNVQEQQCSVGHIIALPWI